MKVKELAATVSFSLLFVCPSVTSPAIASQVENPNASESVVLGENPLIRELGPLRESPALRTLAVDAGYRLRVVYLIPGNRTAQPGAKESLQGFVIRMQDWFRDHMERLGYSPKTFTFEPEADGTAPKIDFIYVAQPDSYFHSDYLGLWSNVLNGIGATGFPIWQHGIVTLVVAETHVQEPDGSLRAGTTFFGGAGTSVSGVAMVTGETLARMSEQSLTDDRFYSGLVIPQIGPYPLVQDVSFPWFEGSTISSVSSSAQGGTMHELGHAFNLWHDFRNDYNFNGNLMGNGLRGLRGSLFPRLYPSDDVGLSTGSALMLDNSRFFNPGQSITDDFAPGGEIVTNGIAIPVKGLCELSYSAYDADSLLAGALLIRGGQVVGDTPLDVPMSVGTLSTYDYTPGVEDEWNVLVIDRQGNTTVSSGGVRIQCAVGYNRAPHPDIHVATTRVEVGEQVWLDAGGSTDPDGNWSNLTVRWDLDGDGIFDTSPTTSKTHTSTYSRPGIYQVVAELTDEGGDSTVSVPIGIRVERHELSEVPIRIDIKPFDGQNTIRPRAKGPVWVAILSDGDFEPLQIDVSSVRLGPGGAGAVRSEVWDLNGDGANDLALRFRVPDTGIRCGDTEATLAGHTTSGLSFTATDSITTVGCHKEGRR
jgi:PKD domain